jgi:sugar O-acyltransferase (sialic acid O-acetyltransferase NeuD family)
MVSMKKMFVYGASGHGKVVADILIACKQPNFVGFVDDRADLGGANVLGLPVCGNGQWLQQEAEKMPVAVALGIGDNFVRQQVAEQCFAWGAELVTVVHPTASVSASVRLGPGTVVMAQVAINPDSRIGRGAIVNTSASVDHDVEIGDFAHVAPNASMGGASRLGTLSQLGIGAVIIHGVGVGARSMVGAGAVVVSDIPDGVVAFGVPARIHRKL